MLASGCGSPRSRSPSCCSYYATHRYAFNAVAAGVRQCRIGASGGYYGAPLPWYLRDLSTTGRATVVGWQGDRPAVFLPQWLGITDCRSGSASRRSSR